MDKHWEEIIKNILQKNETKGFYSDNMYDAIRESPESVIGEEFFEGMDEEVKKIIVTLSAIVSYFVMKEGNNISVSLSELDNLKRNCGGLGIMLENNNTFILRVFNPDDDNEKDE
jgi:hypothetical protein